ncbi:unnamed protein product [Adineta steineri]|uniref:Uncharacterized protein n=1 Tax=Adineta steineri TaxID=433720 RepID=A0A813V2M8_9BILA|nr:unnamed protein product [Adineta steineri]CAF1123902.1 unnamed protein product [Adineta steineri]
MYYLGHVCRIQPHVVKLHHHRSRGKLRPSITTKSSSISILHVTIRSQNNTHTAQKQSNNEQIQLQLNSAQRSKDLIRSVNVYRKVSVSQSFLKNKVEPKKSIDSFKDPIKSDIPPDDDLYQANKNLDQTTLQIGDFLGNKLPNSINNDSEINKNYPGNVTPDKLFMMNDVRKRKFKNQLRTRQNCEKLHYNVSATQSTGASSSSNQYETRKTLRESNKQQQSQNTVTSASDILADVQQESGDGKTDDREEKAIRNAVFTKLLQLVIEGNTSTDDNNEEFHKVRCGACGSHPIRSDRYKCLNCEKLNLCAQCFERRKESRNHKSGHTFIHFKSPNELFGRSVTDDDVTFNKLRELYKDDVHESISCDGCHSPAIKGLRFKCDTCSNYDLCEQCLKAGTITQTHESTHPLIVISRRAIHQIPADDIELGDELGRGAFGSVHKAKWLSKKRVVACKVILVPRTSNAEILQKSFLKEIAAYAELSGAYILKTYGFAVARNEKGKIFMLIMEFMSRGSLKNLIQEKGNKISLRRKLDMAINIASGMRKIHEHKMIHRDIRPDNILINEYYVAKIGDMGIARTIDPLNQHTQIGCQPYMPPEFYSGTYDQKLDIFTFGLTLNELFTSTRHMFHQFANTKIAFQEQSPIFADLIARCTTDDPKRRPTAIEIEKTLDLYITGFNEIILKKHPSYINLSTEDKDEIFVAFHEKFHPPATEFIRKKFPSEFLEHLTDVPGVKVDKNVNNEIRIECPVQ